MVDVALRVTLSLSCLWAVLLASSLAWGQATSTPRNGLPSASGQQLPAPNLTVPEQTYPCNPGSYVPSDNAGAPELAPQHDCNSLIEPDNDGSSTDADDGGTPSPVTVGLSAA